MCAASALRTTNWGFSIGTMGVMKAILGRRMVGGGLGEIGMHCCRIVDTSRSCGSCCMVSLSHVKCATRQEGVEEIPVMCLLRQRSRSHVGAEQANLSNRDPPRAP